jgi:carboxymethylenebutenolidase
VGQDIRLTASDGFELGGYRAEPAGAPKGAIVVIQEIFGVNHHIRSVCDRLAKQGYVAIAPAIFDRTEPNFTSGYSPDEVTNARKFVANPDWAAMLRDTQAAIDAVKDTGPVGIVGFCLAAVSPTSRQRNCRAYRLRSAITAAPSSASPATSRRSRRNCISAKRTPAFP